MGKQIRGRGFKGMSQEFKMIRLHEEELKDVLKNELGLDKVRRHTGRKGLNYQFCCPFHGESRPSAGIVLQDDGAMFGQCYTCEETFTLPKLYAHVKGIEMMEAIDELEEKYRSEIRTEVMNIGRAKRYEDIDEERVWKRRELPKLKLAPFRSGKETHQYFYDRGFDEKDVEECKIGWDRTLKRITIPLFHADGVLAGFSGRAVLEQKLPNGNLSKSYIKHYGNAPKYFLYENVPINELLYGSHEFPEGEKTAIIVEGLFDRIWMRKMGFKNALSIIIAKMSFDRDGGSHQKDILHALGVETVIFMHDNDKAGSVGKQITYDLLKNDFRCYDTTYPEDYKDVLGDDENPPMTKKQIEKMLANKKPFGQKKLPRL